MRRIAAALMLVGERQQHDAAPCLAACGDTHVVFRLQLRAQLHQRADAVHTAEASGVCERCRSALPRVARQRASAA